MTRDIVVLTPEEFEHDRHIPGTIARPASTEGRILYDGAAYGAVGGAAMSGEDPT